MKEKILLITLLFSFYSFSQEYKKDTLTSNFQTGFSLEAHNSESYGMSFGGIVGRNFGDKFKPNYAAGIYVDLIFLEEPIVGQRLKLNLNYIGIFGFNVNFAVYNREGIQDFRLTPEVNFSLYGKANLFLGYNLSVSKVEFDEIAPYRIGVNINIMGR